MSPSNVLNSRLTGWCGAVCCLLLAACGGGQAGSSGGPSGTTEVEAREVQMEGGRLNAKELEQIAHTGVLPKSHEGPSLSGASMASDASAKSAASRTAVYRFFNTRTGAHFFTTNVAERDNLRTTVPYMFYEETAFYASGTPVPGLSPVHRFFNTRTGVHFYTISESERAMIVASLPQFFYEGIAYHASTLPGTGYAPLYRFFRTDTGFHFYTGSSMERDNIIATLPQYHYEGIGYYVLGSDWQSPMLPHTGVTATQCYQAGSDTLVACSSSGALALNPQQDGHRTAIHPMGYALRSTLYGEIPVTFNVTDCVRDQVTGLHWEGKTASGDRAGTNGYLGGAAVSSGYVSLVNTSQLCAFNDWRMPNAEELHGLVSYGATTLPTLNQFWFPNSRNLYWTSTPVGNGSGTSTWVTSFSGTGSYVLPHNVGYGVRLVRGAAWSGPRHLLTSVSYPGDGANNAVIDRWSGLTWRRCLQGQAWNGTTCTGTPSTFTHEAALVHARGQSGWRLPNVKELFSVMDRGRINPSLDTTMFPGAAVGDHWSSTPLVHTLAGYALTVDSNFGFATPKTRATPGMVRLILNN